MRLVIEGDIPGGSRGFTFVNPQHIVRADVRHLPGENVLGTVELSMSNGSTVVAEVTLEDMVGFSALFPSHDDIIMDAGSGFIDKVVSFFKPRLGDQKND